MPFKTIQEGILSVRQQVLPELKAEAVQLYIPLLSRHSNVGVEEPRDLGKTVEGFTDPQDPKKVLVLYGDAGSGKSAFCQQLALKLWESYAWGQPIPLFISLPRLKDPLHHAIEEVLLGYGFTAAQILELKEKNRFVFIFDGYDELHQLQNLYVSNRLSEWQAKTIISCRTQYFYNKSNSNLYFMPLHAEREQYQLLSTLYVVPFNQVQIEQYLSLSRERGVSIPSYSEMIAVPGLQELITTPFLLHLTIEALPEILSRYSAASASAEERKRLTQMELYTIFITQWFLRQEAKLKASGHITPDSEDRKPVFWRYCQALAKEMHQRNVTWIDSQDENFAVYFESDAETDMIRSACPLRKMGQLYGFWHQSLNAYFMVQTVYEEELQQASEVSALEQPAEALAMAKPEQPTGLIHSRLVSDDPAALQLYAEQVGSDARFKARLFDIIECSKVDERYAVGAANAISALNAAKINFSGKNLQGICIPNANLTDALMPYTDLSNSNLSGVQFYNAVLVCAKLCQANLMNASFLRGISSILSQSEVETMVLHPKRVGVAIYGDGSDIVVVRLANEVIEQRLSHRKSIKSLAVDSNRMLASGCEDGSISLWTLQDEKLTYFKNFTAHRVAVESLAFGSDGILASGGWLENIICLWDTRRGGIYLNSLQGHAGMGLSLTFSSEGMLASACQGKMDSTIRLWDIRHKDAYLKSLIGHKSVICLAFSKEGLLASGDWDGSIYLWDPKREVSQLKKFKGHMALVSSLAFAQDGGLASGYQDGTIYLWHLKGENIFFQIFSGHQGSISSLVFDLNGMLISGSKDSTLRLWEPKPENMLLASLLDSQDHIASSVYDPRGMHARPDRDRWARNLGRDEKEDPLSTEQHIHDVINIAIGPDEMIVSICKNGDICFWNSKQENAISSVFKSQINSAKSFAVSSIGLVAIGDEEGAIHLWNSKDKDSAVEILKKQTSAIFSLAFSSNGLLASGGKDGGIIHIWNTRPEISYLKSLDGAATVLSSLIFLTDNILISGDSRGVVRMWDLSREEALVKNFKVERYISRFDFAYVSSLALSPDGIIASGHDDGTICLWDPKQKCSFTPLKILKEHTNSINVLSFSPDKLWLISGSDKTIVIWDAHDWSKAPRRFAFGSKYFCFNWPFLHLTHGKAIHTIDFSDFPPNLEWMLATAPSALWAQGCDVTDAKNASTSVEKLFKRSGAIGEPLETLDIAEAVGESLETLDIAEAVGESLETLGAAEVAIRDFSLLMIAMQQALRALANEDGSVDDLESSLRLQENSEKGLRNPDLPPAESTEEFFPARAAGFMSFQGENYFYAIHAYLSQKKTETPFGFVARLEDFQKLLTALKHDVTPRALETYLVSARNFHHRNFFKGNRYQALRAALKTLDAASLQQSFDDYIAYLRTECAGAKEATSRDLASQLLEAFDEGALLPASSASSFFSASAAQPPLEQAASSEPKSTVGLE